jgi:hypothetical protein
MSWEHHGLEVWAAVMAGYARMELLAHTGWANR